MHSLLALQFIFPTRTCQKAIDIVMQPRDAAKFSQSLDITVRTSQDRCSFIAKKIDFNDIMIFEACLCIQRHPLIKMADYWIFTKVE